MRNRRLGFRLSRGRIPVPYGIFDPPFATLSAPTTANEGDDPSVTATSSNPGLSLTLQDISPVVGVDIQTGVVSPYSTSYPNVTPGARQVQFFNEANPAEKTNVGNITVTPQAATISAPTAGANVTIGSSLTLTADGTVVGWDANTTKVEFYVGGVLRLTVNSATGGVWTGSWDTTGASVATVDVVAKRYWVGLAGETGSLDSASVSINLVSGIGPTDPLTIVSSVSPFFFLSADVGITIATGVSAWADQSGNGNNANQGSGAAQPALITADSDFGGRNSVSGDGSNDSLVMTWNPPAPGTTNVWFFAVLLQKTWTAGEWVMAGGNTILSFAQSGSTPQMRMLNGMTPAANGGAPIGTGVRLEALFSNSTSDYMRLASTTTTGTNAGNSDAPAFYLFSRNAAGFSDVKIACVGAWNGKPTPTELTDLTNWVTNYYGGGIGV